MAKKSAKSAARRRDGEKGIEPFRFDDSKYGHTLFSASFDYGELNFARAAEMLAPRAPLALKLVSAAPLLGIVLCMVTCLLYDAIIPYRAVSIEMLPVILAFIVAVAVSALVGFLMARKSNEVFGMVNGDILGATNEICRPAVMFVMLLVFVLW